MRRTLLAGPATKRRVSAVLGRVLPGSGFGPSPDRLEDWSWSMRVEAATTGGHAITVNVEAQGHPGYLATARMLGEAGLILSERPPAAGTGGCLTPAAALGTASIPRFERARDDDRGRRLTVANVELKREGGIAYREARPEGDELGDPVLLIHGFPQSSYMWEPVVEAAAAAGRRAIAPDLPGYGDSAPDSPGTWERHVEAIERFRRALGLERVTLGLHDWGGLIGLRWAFDHGTPVSALILSNTGFFADTQWHTLGRVLRTPGQGEQLMDNLTKDALSTMIRDVGGRLSAEAIDEYWKAFETPGGRMGILELYRSGDFEKLRPYEGQVASMNVPALILWGENDPTVPVDAARRFEHEIRETEVVILEEASHFIYDDEPERCAREVAAFLSRHHD